MMARHTELSEEDISAISAAYRLEALRWRPIEGGDENSSFLLSTRQGEFVITFYEKKSIAEAGLNARLLIHLAEHGYHTNQVIPAKDGNVVSIFQGKSMVLKTWIPGETLRDVPQSDYHSIGRAIAGLHRIPAPGILPREHPYGLESIPTALNLGIDPEYEEWLGEKLDYLRMNYPTILPKTFIHGDLFDDNIIFFQEQFQAIIDFGDACFYTRAYDLGSVMFGACMQDGKLNIDQSRQVVAGYQEITETAPEEFSMIQFFAVYAGTAISAWHYRNIFEHQLEKSKSKKYKRAARRTDHIFRLPQEVFAIILGEN